MDEIAARIMELIEKTGLSYRELEEKTRIPKSAIQRYAVGETRKIPIDRLEALANALGTSTAYLMGWTGDAAADLAGISNLMPIRRVKVPLLGSIAAGEPILAEQEYDTYAEADGDVHSDYALRVDGDSMEPTVRRGDLVFIRRQEDVNDGEIAAVLIDDSATLKRVYHVKNGLTLSSDNAAKYPPRIVTYPEYDTIRILGKAVAFKRLL